MFIFNRSIPFTLICLFKLLSLNDLVILTKDAFFHTLVVRSIDHVIAILSIAHRVCVFLVPSSLVFSPPLSLLNLLIIESFSQRKKNPSYSRIRQHEHYLLSSFFSPLLDAHHRWIFFSSFESRKKKRFFLPARRWRTTIILLDIFDELIERFISLFSLYIHIYIYMCLLFFLARFTS